MRKASLVQTAIWESDFTALSVPGMLVYLMLITQPTVMTTGMLAIAEKRWRRYCHDELDQGLAELEERRFVWIDWDHEELVVRSWVKHNVVGNSKMIKAARDQLGAITSTKLRGLLVAEYPGVFTPNGDTPSYALSDTPSDRASDTPSLDTPSHALSGSTWSEERGPRPEEPAVSKAQNRRARETGSSQPPHGRDDKRREPPTLPPQLAKLLDTKLVNELKPGQVELVTTAWNTDSHEIRHSIASIEAADNPAAMLVTVAKRVSPTLDDPANTVAGKNSRHAAAIATCRRLYQNAIADGDTPDRAREWLENEYRHDPSIVTEALTTTASSDDVPL